VSSTRINICLVIILSHLVGLCFLLHNSSTYETASIAGTRKPMVGIVMDTAAQRPPGTPEPDLVRFRAPEIPPVSVRIGEDETAREAHLAPAQIDASSQVPIAPFARSAGLHKGEAASVVLTVEVLPSGSAGVVTVARSGGSATIDAAAVAYVRALRWIAARSKGEPIAMRILFGVSLEY
jgi:TonB family protein